MVTATCDSVTPSPSPIHTQSMLHSVRLCPQIAYRDRLKAIRETLEVSPFFKCHEVGRCAFSLDWHIVPAGSAPITITPGSNRK